jgi:hypothetical protein
MTDIDIAAARALCDAATPGPWVGGWEGQSFVVRATDGSEVTRQTFAVGFGEDWASDAFRDDCDNADAAFIAAARDLVPALLDEVERLRGEHIGLGWFCRECRLWIKPWEQGDPPLSMTCPQCDNRAFTWTGAQVERDEARAEVERLQRIISEHSCSPRDALDMD